MKRFIGLPVVLVVMTLAFLSSCNKDNNGVNIFTVEDDMQLGLQMEQQIQGDPANYPLLDKTQYTAAYQHLVTVRNTILGTGLVTYDTRGVAGFFEKINGSPQPPEFLSTHPNPENQIEKITEVWESLGGKTGHEYVAEYQQFKNSLP